MKSLNISRVLTLLSVVIFVGLVDASHFRYGTVRWTPSTDATKVTFSLELAYRADFAYYDPSQTSKLTDKTKYTPNPEPSNLYYCQNVIGTSSESVCASAKPAQDNVLFPNSNARKPSQYSAVTGQAGTFCWQTAPGLAWNAASSTYTCSWIWATVNQIDNTASGNFIIVTFNYTASFTGSKGFYNFVYYDYNRLTQTSGLQNNANTPWSLYGTFELANTKTGNAWNKGPSSAMVPILQVYRKYINKIGIYASDDGPTSALRYSMSDAAKICYTPTGASDQKAPCSLLSGATIPSATNPVFNVDTTGSLYTGCTANPCYFQTQITVSDATTSIPIDFLMVLVDAPITCDKSCNNAGAVCTDDGTCKNCTSTSLPSGRTCHPTGTLPYFVFPTPNNNAHVNFTALRSNNVTINATSDDKTVSLYLSTPNTPSGTTASRWADPVGANPSQKTLSWTPSLTDVGSYAVTISVKDSNGLVMLGSAQGFFIDVIAPDCGYGDLDKTSGKCVCPKYDGVNTGFDPTCTECQDGFFGVKCQPCPNCNRGTCIDGLDGTGQCFCANGWVGAFCNVSQQAYCDNGRGSAVISQVNSTNYVSVESVNAYVASNQQFTALQIPITVNVPSKILLDVMVLVDTATGYTTSSKNNLAGTNTDNFYNALAGYSNLLFLGAAYFTTSSDTLYTSKLDVSVATSGANLKDAFANKFPAGNTNTAAVSNRQIQSVIQAINTATSWRPKAFKVISVLTGGPTSFTDADVNALQAACLAANIVPVFAVASATASDLTNYQTLVSRLGFGAAIKTSPAYSNYAVDVPAAIGSVISKVIPTVASDAAGFVSNLVPTSQAISLPSTSQIQVNLQYPNGASFTGTPIIKINVMGYGTTTFTLNVNHAPTNKNSPETVKFARYSANNLITPGVTDEDNNFLTVYFSTLPTGTLLPSVTSGTPIKTGVGYALSTANSPSLFWTPPYSNWYGTTSFNYNATDGCLVSSTFTLNIQVDKTPGIPTCSNIIVNAYQNRKSVIQFTGGQDDDDTAAQLVYTITGTPDNGVLSQTNGNSLPPNVAANQQIVFTPNNNYFTATGSSPDTITFTVTNSGGNSNAGDPCTVSVNVIHVNQQPTVGSTAITLARGASGSVSLSSKDIDSPAVPETATYQITGVTAASGTNGAVTLGYTVNGQAKTSDSSSATYPLTVSSPVTLTNGASSFPLSITVPNSATANLWVTIYYRVFDSNNSVSDVASVTVTVSPPNAPTASSISVRTPLGTNSANFALNGAAVDAADIGGLTTVITSLPSKATLYYTPTGAAVTVGSSYPTSSANNFYIVPGPVGSTSYGSDSFTFTVNGRPNGGIASQPGTASIYILFVNRAPTLTSQPQSGLQGTLFNFTNSLTGADADNGQTLTAYITAFPTNGILTKYGTATPINACSGTYTPSSPCAVPATVVGTNIVFYVSYLPQAAFFTNSLRKNTVVNPPDSFSAFVQDSFAISSDTSGPSPGQSATATVSITVNEAEDAPVAVGSSQNVNRYDAYNSFTSAYTLTLAGTDDNTEDQVAGFSAFIVSLPPTSLVSSVTTSDGKQVSAGSTITGDLRLTFNLVKYAWGTATVNFKVSDIATTYAPTTMSSANTAAATLNVAFVNIPPVCKFTPVPSSSSNLVALSRNVNSRTEFDLSVVDPDSSQRFDYSIYGYNVTAVSPGQNNSYIQVNGVSLTVGGTASATSKLVTEQVVAFFYGNGVAAAGAETLWTSFNFSVTDGIATSYCYVPISVTSKDPPVANPLDTIYMSECSKTTCVVNGTRQITGTDSDGTPTPFLLTLPTHGFLYDLTTNVQITSPGGQTNAFYYKPEAYYVGDDSYQFYVQDVQGSSSVKLTGQIVVSHKPYPPVAQFNGPLTTPEETPLGINVQTVNIIAYKNDGVTVDPTVTVYISNFSTNNSVPGKLYQYGSGSQTDGIANAGSQITITPGAAVAIVNSNFSFIYVPPPNTYGPALSSVTFYVVSTDNLQSNVITFPIDVTFVPKSPVPISSSVTFAQNTPTPTVTPLQITDPNNYHDGPTILTAKIESLPSKNYTLVRGDGTAVVVGDSFQATAGFVNDVYIQTVTPGAYQFGSTSFTFSASNNFGKNSVQVATVNVTITPIILAPGAFAPTPITVTRTVPYTFTLTATDPQPDNTISLVYSSSTVGSAGGVFSDSQSKAISAALTTLASGTESGIYTTTVSFLAPALATGNDYANFTFYSQIDTVKSDPFTVHVNVAPNNNPTANPLNVSCQEDSHTDAFSLTGDDADVADKTSLTFVLTTLPPASAGVLTVVSTGAAAVTDTPYSFTSVQLVFTPVALQGTTEGFYGTTSFSFTAVDQLGGASQEALVTVNVEHVNHQPTASAPGINTTQNSVASFAVTYSDVDTMDSPTVAYIQILSATVSGQLLTQSGQVVTGPFPFNGATNSFQFQFRPNKDTFGNLGSITLVYNDAQNASNSASATVTVPIFYAQVPYPPIGDNTNVTTDQGVPVTVTFPGSDQDSPISTVTIQTFPAGGIIKRPDGTQVTSANPTIPCTVPQVTPADLTKANTITSYTASCQAIYVPYTTNTAGDSFTYTVTDTTGLSSSTYSASVTVIANRPPPIVIPTPTFPVVNNNTMIIDVLENSLAIFSVRGASQDGDLTGYPYAWRLYLTSTVARGDLEFYNTADDGTYTVVPVVNVASNGTLFYASSNLYQFKFQPPQNVFGANFANFQFFVRDPNGDSIVWTIIFNVIHVPQTPILSAVTYQVIDSDQKPVGVETPWDFTARSPIVGIENTDVVISWNATSIDVDTGVISWLALQTVLVLSPQKGAFYAAYKQADGSFKIGDQIEKSTTGVSAKVIIVPRDLNNDKLWRVVFRPVKNDHAYVYSTFTLEAIDTVQPGNLTSLVRTANIRIKSVPAPPTAQWAIDGPVNNHTLIQLTANSVIISGNVTAPDAGINPIAMNVTLVRVDGQPITTENITLAGAVVAGRKKNQCSYVTPSFVTCKDNTIKLNSYLSQVVLVNLQTSVIYNLVLQVNSLGAGADKGETDLYSIEVSDVAVLKVNPASIVAPIPQKNNNALAGIIAGASVAGAFAAFGAFRLIRKSNPPITGFFGEEAFAGNAITDNPLYEQSGGNFDNPLYHHETA